MKSAITDGIAGVKITPLRKGEGATPPSTEEETFPRNEEVCENEGVFEENTSGKPFQGLH